jgi:hypothetical protein
MQSDEFAALVAGAQAKIGSIEPPQQYGHCEGQSDGE